MSEKNTGGPAFPVHTDPSSREWACGSFTKGGMTLRDYFAAHAPAQPEWFFDHMAQQGTYVGPDTAEAFWRYHHADMMLKAREE